MTSAILAVLLALQVGQGKQVPMGRQICGHNSCPVGHYLVFADEESNGSGKFVCTPTPHRPRPQDLMPLVEPLPPLNECERLDGDIVELLCFNEWPNIMDLITQDSMRQAEQEEAYRKSGGVMTNMKLGPAIVIDGAKLPPSSPHRFWQSVVPAVQRKNCSVVRCDKGENCEWKRDSCSYWTCADKSRVLLSSEDGSGHWCVRF